MTQQRAERFVRLSARAHQAGLTAIRLEKDLARLRDSFVPDHVGEQGLREEQWSHVAAALDESLRRLRRVEEEIRDMRSVLGFLAGAR